MLIDWFTVGAQLINFLILVWLLKRFLYQPVLDAIAAREQRIAAELAKAASTTAAAQAEHEELDRRNKAFDSERAELVARDAQQNARERESLLHQAHKDADELRATSASALAADRTLLGRQVARLAQREVFAIARRALTDLANSQLEERIGEVFTRQLRALDGRSKALMASALQASSEPALLRSGFDLPAMDRATIQNALNEAFSAEVRVRFVTVPDVVCGIELSADGQKLAWSIAEYLQILEQKLDALIAPGATPSVPASPSPVAPAPAAPAPSAVAADSPVDQVAVAS